MPNFPNLRHLYNPVQPAIRLSGSSVNYTRILPDTRLQPFIHSYWALKTTKVLPQPFLYNVVADGCIDIFFELNGPENNYVMGFCNSYTEFPLGTSFHYGGVCFLPSVFPQLFAIPASALSNRTEHLREVLPGTSRFIRDHFHEGLGTGDIKRLFDQYFLDLIANVSFQPDNRIYNALNRILVNSTINIEKDLDIGMSPRNLRRLFKYYIGDGPKTFSKIVRFQKLLRAVPSRENLRKDKTFFDTGYYDQAHFIKEFKNFYGATPGQAFIN